MQRMTTLALRSLAGLALVATLALAQPTDYRATAAEFKALQSRLYRTHGIADVYVSGGSAIALLDAAYANVPYSIRDLDFIVVANRSVTEGVARSIARSLLPKDKKDEIQVWPMPRTNPALKPPHDVNYVAGYGFEIKRPGQATLDVNVMHSFDDTRLNGALDIERVKVKVNRNESLDDVVEKLRRLGSPENAARAGLLWDEDGGYKAWRNHSLSVVNWGPIERNPENWALRLTRALEKTGAKALPPDVEKRLRTLMQSQTSRDRQQLLRNLEKNLIDASAARQLKRMAGWSALEGLSPALQRHIESSDVTTLERELGGVPHERLERLLMFAQPEATDPLHEAFRQLRGFSLPSQCAFTLRELGL